jgi:hypothetical protein
MSLAEAIRPIEAAEDKVQLTFFNGSADAWHILASNGDKGIRIDQRIWKYQITGNIRDKWEWMGISGIRSPKPNEKL